MKVKFLTMYFGPDGNRYRPGIIHDVSDEWKKILPKSAEIMPDEMPVGPVSPAPVLTRSQRLSMEKAEKKAEKAAEKAAEELEEVELAVKGPPAEGFATVAPNAKTKAGGLKL